MDSKFGTLNEKSIHRVLKGYIDSSIQNQEVSIGSYIADILNDAGIYEIQSAHFYKLKTKLIYYLDNTNFNITIVYPISTVKYINWVNPIDNSVVERRKSPHKINKLNIFKELYGILDILVRSDSDRIHLRIISLQTEEYKYLDGYGPSNRYKATKIDKIPTSIISDLRIDNIKELISLLPLNTLPIKFTSNELKKQAHCSIEVARQSLLVCTRLGLIQQLEKHGNRKVYTNPLLNT